MDTASYLITIPVEVVQHIIEYTHPSGHWPLAQTCSYLYQNSERVLSLHRNAYQKYRITSDLDPVTIPHLLWSVFSHGTAHIDAWHVREFEVWDPDEDGASEVDLDPHEASEVGSDPGQGPSAGGIHALSQSLPGFDIDYFCEKLLKVPDFFPDEYQHLWGDYVRYELETGREIMTKSFMLAHLPRIRAIRCSKSGRERHPGVELLSECIYWCKSAGTWLPGLETLEKISVSIPPDVLDRRILNTCPDDFAALLCLPNLSEVYFAHLDGDFELSDMAVDLSTNNRQALLDKTSPVRTIILDELENSLSENLIDFLAKMPRALQNLAIRFGANNNYQDCSKKARSLIKALSKHQGKCLQRLCFDSNSPPVGKPLAKGIGLNYIRAFDDLRAVNLDWPAVESKLAASGEEMSRQELLDRLLTFFRSCLPAQMEVLMLNISDTVRGMLNGELARGDRGFGYIDEAVEAAIKSRRYTNLKAVLVKDVQMTLGYIASGNLDFPKAAKAAEERGIYIDLKFEVPPPEGVLDGSSVPILTRSCMVTREFRPQELMPTFY
ncbi:unnamed protein product [Clonostachys rosea]|uniref:F-box domain-containing protein n=1 Tax=Bionectria ochroleuca TaxID=29856 RepID=A0ABY6US80_BIOOC|nr:unnamed protein product [Clonostachys rosea]